MMNNFNDAGGLALYENSTAYFGYALFNLNTRWISNLLKLAQLVFIASAVRTYTCQHILDIQDVPLHHHSNVAGMLSHDLDCISEPLKRCEGIYLCIRPFLIQYVLNKLFIGLHVSVLSMYNLCSQSYLTTFPSFSIYNLNLHVAILYAHLIFQECTWYMEVYIVHIKSYAFAALDLQQWPYIRHKQSQGERNIL